MARKRKLNKDKIDFPLKGKFRTMEEVNAYFDRDKITCLICGKQYISLHNHVRIKHLLSAADYKEKFGIPWRKGLISRTLKKKLRNIMNHQREMGVIPQAPSSAHIKRLRKSVANRRPIANAVRHALSQHALRVHGRLERWGQKDFHEYLNRIKSGRTLTEVGKDKDMPSREVFDKWLRENTVFRLKFEKVWDALPFAVQVKGQRTGQRFKKTIVKLRRQGKTWPEIAKVMGVLEGTVRNTWHRLNTK